MNIENEPPSILSLRLGQELSQWIVSKNPTKFLMQACRQDSARADIWTSILKEDEPKSTLSSAARYHRRFSWDALYYASDPTYDRAGSFIKTTREFLGWTRVQLGRQLGLHTSGSNCPALQKWESGQTEPGPSSRNELRSFFEYCDRRGHDMTQNLDAGEHSIEDRWDVPNE